MEISGAIRQTTGPPVVARPARPPESAWPSGTGAAAEGPSPEIPRDVVRTLASEAAADTPNGSRIRVDETTERIVVEILNSDNEVIKQIPPEALLRALARSRRVTGLILDQQT
jgi:hypothetical protein